MKNSPSRFKLIGCLALSLVTGTAASEGLVLDRANLKATPSLFVRMYQQNMEPSAATFGQCLGSYALPSVAQSARVSESGPRQITAELDRLIGEREGVFELQGNVVIEDGRRQLLSELAVLDQDKQLLRFPQGLVVLENEMVLQGDQASIGLEAQTLELGSVQWLLSGQNLRGTAGRLEQTGVGQVVLQEAELTRCAPGNDGWSLGAKRLEINEGAEYAQAEGAVLRIKSIPVAYLPKMRVSLGGDQVSGWQMPSGGISSRDGLELQLPYHWRVNPEIDATIVPRWISRRGVGVDGQLQYDSADQLGELNLSYLSSDDLYNGYFDRETFKDFGGESILPSFEPADRWLVAIDQAGVWGPVSAKFDFSRSSDRDFFRDLDTYIGLANPTALNQFAELAYTTRKLDLRLRTLAFQRLDELYLPDYEVKPALALDYQSNLAGQGFGWSVSAQVAEFARRQARRQLAEPAISGAQGRRSHLQPSVSYRQDGLSGFWAFRGGLKATSYELDRSAQDSTGVYYSDSHRSVGFVTADVGWFLEREIGSARGWIQTLEPRIFYLRQGFEAQDDLPVFDSIPASVTFDQLFSDTRFTGPDRVSDANRLTLAATSRLLTSRGREKAKLSFAYMDHLSVPRMSWPSFQDIAANDLVAGEQRVNLSDRWELSAWQLWNKDRSLWEELRASLHLRGAGRRVYNFGYSHREFNDIKQTEFSAYAPVSQNIAFNMRWHYDLESHRTLEAFFGVEYDDCCMKVRLVAHQYLENPGFQNLGLPIASFPPDELRTDRGVLIEIQLKGLAGIGSKVDALLRRSVYGYESAGY